MDDSLPCQAVKPSATPAITPGSKSLLWASKDGCFAVNRAPAEHGRILYRNRPIADLPRIAIDLVIGRHYAVIDRLLRAAPRPVDHAERLLGTCCRLFARRGVRNCVDAQRIIVVRSRRAWHDGHPLLEAIAAAANPPPETAWPAPLTAKVFRDRYYARSRPAHPLLELKYARLERDWRDQGRRPLPGCFAAFGVLTAEKHLRDRQARASAEAKGVRGDKPSPAEAQAINVLADAFALLDPDLCATVRRHPPGYRIAETQVIMGTLRAPRRSRDAKVYLCRQIFTFDFPRALAVFVHEHSHVLGCDGSREFTDQLTWLLESLVRRRMEFDDLEARWLRARDSVRRAGLAHQHRRSPGMKRVGSVGGSA